MSNETKKVRTYLGTPFEPDDDARKGWHVSAMGRETPDCYLRLVEEDEYAKLEADLARVTEERDTAIAKCAKVTESLEHYLRQDKEAEDRRAGLRSALGFEKKPGADYRGGITNE